MLPENIELQVVTPERHVLQANVQAVEIPGKEGYLGILPGHALLIKLTRHGNPGPTAKSQKRDATSRPSTDAAKSLPDCVRLFSLRLPGASRGRLIPNVPAPTMTACPASEGWPKPALSTPEWEHESWLSRRAAVRLRKAVGKMGGGSQAHS